MGTNKIEWLRDPATGKPGITINPVKGLCPVDCKDTQGKSYCYARRIYKRFKWNPEIRYEPGTFLGLPSEPSKVFVGSTMELFGPWVKSEWLSLIFEAVKVRPQHTFIFRTKQPQNLPKEWPENCWVGISVDGTPNAPPHRIYNRFDKVQATVKFLSVEPLLAQTKLDPRDLKWAGISWVIIGEVTPVRKATMPKISWVKEIVEAADKASIPVFLKENLRPLLVPGENHKPGDQHGLMIDCFWADDKCHLRQEWPKEQA